MFDDYGRSDRNPLLERSLYEAGYKDGYDEGYRKGEENIRKRNVLSVKQVAILEQSSKTRVIELATYWYEEAMFWQDECRRVKHEL